MKKTLSKFKKETCSKFRQLSMVAKILLAIVLFGLSDTVSAQNCSVNAGGNFTSCTNAVTLNGSRSANFSGTPTWTLHSFVPSPGGSSSTASVVIASPTSLVTNVTGLNTSGVYTFRITQPCTAGGNAVSDVAVTIFANTGFTAGADVGGICATTGTTNLTGAVIPPGFTGVWTIENTYKRIRYNQLVNTNSTLSSTTIANPTFSLTNKTNHTEDPTYTLTLTITSLDGSCSYTDDRIVTFCPNPNIGVPASFTRPCTDLTGTEFVQWSTAPIWATTQFGFVSAGTLTVNVSSQPPGANMVLARGNTNSGSGSPQMSIQFDGMTQLGTYTYTITASSCCGSFTTASSTITLTAKTPSAINLLPTDHPTQLAGWLGGSSGIKGGEIHCNRVLSTTPEVFYFDINSADPASLPFTVTNGFGGTVLPPGASTPTFTTAVGIPGNTRRVAVTVNPGASGWRAGSYFFTVTYGNAPCTRNDSYVIHISDNGRVNLAVANQTVCFPGTGSVTATINLPTRFVATVANPSYFQSFGSTLGYNFTTLSQPAGSATPVFAAQDDRQLIDATTTISNLNTPGEYRFRMTINNGNGSSNFVNRDFACSGASDVVEFSIFLETTQTANAGSGQSFSCSNLSALAGNAPTGTNTGLWQLVSKPSGSATPTIVSSTSASTSLTGFDTPGNYTFSWTISTASGQCTSTSQVTINIQALVPTLLNATPGCPGTTVQLNGSPSGGTWSKVSGLGTSSVNATTGLVTFGLGATGNHVFNYFQGTCSDNITVLVSNTVSGPGSATTCINTAIPDITHTTIGATGIGTPVNLPTGVNASWSANVITISGTPSQSGSFNYTIPLTGGCGPVLNATGTITVNALNTASTEANTIVCEAIAISRTQSTTGATGIGTASGLPAGITASWSANTITFTGNSTVSNTYNYSIPLTGGCGPVSATGTIIVLDRPANRNPNTGPTICSGATASISLANSQSGISYQLRLNSDNSNVGSAVAGTGGTISFSASPTATTVYNVLATNATTLCTRQMTNTTTVTVNPLPTLSLAVDSPTICTGQSATITVSNSQSGIRYQLRLNSNNSNVGSFVNGNGGTLNLPAVTPVSTTIYNVLATNATTNCSAQLTATSTVTVNSLTSAGTIAASQTICIGATPAAFTSSAVATGTAAITYQWQSSTDSGTTWNNIGSATNATYVSGALTQTTQFRRLAFSGGCPVAGTASNVVTVTVISVKPGITTGTALKSDIIISSMNISTTDLPVNNGYMVLDSKSKGMVITRMPTANLPTGASAIKGMLVYDTTVNCLKMYDGTAWGCLVPACPD